MGIAGTPPPILPPIASHLRDPEFTKPLWMIPVIFDRSINCDDRVVFYHVDEFHATCSVLNYHKSRTSSLNFMARELLLRDRHRILPLI